MSDSVGALNAPSTTSHVNPDADTGDSQAARCASAQAGGSAIVDAPNEQNPAGGPGSEMQLAIGNALPSYRTKLREGTVIAGIFDALEGGRALTSGDAWGEYGTSRLASFI